METGVPCKQQQTKIRRDDANESRREQESYVLGPLAANSAAVAFEIPRVVSTSRKVRRAAGSCRIARSHIDMS
jgi:hypothetical protein